MPESWARHFSPRAAIQSEPPVGVVFGEVVEGLDVVKKIGAVPTGRQDRPVTPVVINKVTIERG